MNGRKNKHEPFRMKYAVQAVKPVDRPFPDKGVQSQINNNQTNKKQHIIPQPLSYLCSIKVSQPSVNGSETFAAGFPQVDLFN